ncbi:MAG: hypothetical protein GXP56_00720 [Deltaproteobacteria bacterium]|nr:hypothetical protein [Deltaproteobacteria bacterium]
MNRKIAAVGDSHSLRCFENHALIADSKVYFGYNKLDGKTAYKLKDHDKKVRKIITPIKDKHIIFVFGEVDVRIHIKYQHRQSGIPVKTLVENTAKRYTGYIAQLRNEGFDIHVFNVVPTGDFAGKQFESWEKKLKYPFDNNFKERQLYTLMLNSELNLCCQMRGIPFIDIYQYLVDARGARKKELVYDFAHINSKTADIVMEHYCFSNVLENVI